MFFKKSAAHKNGFKVLVLGCSDDSGCDITRDAGPNCDVNRGQCFYCQNDVHCLDHRNKRCGSEGRCIEGEECKS